MLPSLSSRTVTQVIKISTLVNTEQQQLQAVILFTPTQLHKRTSMNTCLGRAVWAVARAQLFQPYDEKRKFV